jgi:hypothetical protein
MMNLTCTVCAITRAAGVITGTIVPTFKLGLKRFKIVFFVIKQSFNIYIYIYITEVYDHKKILKQENKGT